MTKSIHFTRHILYYEIREVHSLILNHTNKCSCIVLQTYYLHIFLNISLIGWEDLISDPYPLYKMRSNSLVKLFSFYYTVDCVFLTLFISVILSFVICVVRLFASGFFPLFILEIERRVITYFVIKNSNTFSMFFKCD